MVMMFNKMMSSADGKEKVTEYIKVAYKLHKKLHKLHKGEDKVTENGEWC